MMVIDASALVAIMLKEPEKGTFLGKIIQAERALTGAVNALEASMVLHSRLGANGIKDLDAFMFEMYIDIADITADHLILARQAYLAYGKGYHPARLNLGDCFAYALAKSLDAPLLYKGTDFNLTDIATA